MFRVSISSLSIIGEATVVVGCCVVVDALDVVAGACVVGACVAGLGVVSVDIVVVVTLGAAVDVDPPATVEVPVESEPLLHADSTRATEIRHAAGARRRICIPATVSQPRGRSGGQPSFQK